MSKINFENLTEKLDALTGLDYEAAELEERNSGNTAIEMSLNKGFQARLAAHALKVPVQEIKTLPVKKYFAVTSAVSRFLFSDSDTESIQPPKSEESVSA